jgi:mevalonate kinase
MMATVSVPGKIHLSGEHAIVYGKPAILTAVNLRLTATVAVVAGGQAGQFDIDAPEDKSYIRHAFGLVCRKYRIDPVPAVTISINSDLSAGYHLGSSAAVAAAVIGASIFALKKIWNPGAINNLAYEAEKIKHGNPSGGDNTTVVFGGFIWYRKELEFLRTLWQLPIRPSQQLKNNFILVDTGRPVESTGEMVAYVNSKFKSQKSKYRRLFDNNEQVTKHMAAALKENDSRGILEAMRGCERTLEKMGVVSSFAEKIIKQIEKIGGAAKILGGGGHKKGVGYLLSYHPQKNNLVTHLAHHRLLFREILIGEEGVRLEKRS